MSLMTVSCGVTGHLIFNFTENFIISNFKIDVSNDGHHPDHSLLIAFVMDGIPKSVIWNKRGVTFM